MLPYVRGITFSGAVIDLGTSLEGVLSPPNPTRLARIASAVVDGLRRIGGVYDGRPDHTSSIPDVQLAPRPQARTLGLTLEEWARPARAATDAEGFLRRTASGAEVPVIAEASLDAGVSPPAIRQKDHRRVVTVTADVDPAVMSGDEANNILANPVLVDLTAVYPAPTYTLGSEQQQQFESLDALYRGFAIALIMIAALLAEPFIPERAIQARFLIRFAASLACGILFVTTILVIIIPARSTVHLRLIAARGSSGVRAASGIQMQGGHG